MLDGFGELQALEAPEVWADKQAAPSSRAVFQI